MKKLEKECWLALMDKANVSMTIHLWESSTYTNTDNGEFWTSSEDEWTGDMVQTFECFLFNVFFQLAFTFKQRLKYVSKHLVYNIS